MAADITPPPTPTPAPSIPSPKTSPASTTGISKSAPKEMIKAEGVNMSFMSGGKQIDVLKNVNFTVKDNTFNIVYGASGSGKSTLLNILTGLQKPSVGTIMFEGDAVYEFTPDELAKFRAHRIGIVYQQNFWVSSLNVIENVSMPLFFLGYPKALAAKLSMLALERVEMTDYAKKYPVFLSGGEQQRIAMARAIVNDPKIIIADEPTGSLDSKNGDKIMNLLQQVRSEYRRTVILVTHNMEYLPLADHLLHIQDGEVQELKSESIQATTDELMADMKARIDRLSKIKEAGHAK